MLNTEELIAVLDEAANKLDNASFDAVPIYTGVCIIEAKHHIKAAISYLEKS